jgi:hypothetical protein
MTVSVGNGRSEVWTADGINRNWPYPFKALTADHIRLKITTPAGVESEVASGFSVQGVGQDAGGQVVYPLEPAAALASGTKVQVLRRVPLSQLNRIGNQGGFHARTHEDTFDLLEMQIQQVDQDGVERQAATLKEVQEQLGAHVVVVPGTAEYATRTIAALSNIPNSVSFLRTAGYVLSGDGGGALYKRVAAPGTVKPWHLQSADGAWWQIASKLVNAHMLGAKGDGVADDTPAINAMLEFKSATGGGTGWLLEGDYRITESVGSTWPNAAGHMGLGRVFLRGMGAAKSRIIDDIADTFRPAVFFTPTWDNDGRMWARGTIGGFAIYRSKEAIGTAGVTTSALQLKRTPFLTVDDISIIGYDIGLDLEDVLSSSFHKVMIHANRCVYARKGSYSHPNALRFEGCFTTGLWRGFDLRYPGNVSIEGGTIEGCGYGGNVVKAGVYIEGGAVEAGVSVNIRGVYFENNVGDRGDVTFIMGSTYDPGILNIENCNFNRTSNRSHPTCIWLGKGSVAPMFCRVTGSSFRGFGAYTSSNLKPVLYVDTGSIPDDFRVQFDASNYIQFPVEVPQTTKAIAWDGTDAVHSRILFDWGGAVFEAKNLSMVRTSAGLYRLTFGVPMKNTRYKVNVNVGQGSNSDYTWAVAGRTVNYVDILLKEAGSLADANNVHVTVSGGLY